MPRTNRTATMREVRVNLRIARSIDDRIKRLAEVAGQTDSVIAALAIAAGLRTLENSMLPPDAELLTALGEKMKHQVERDIDEQGEVAEAESLPLPVGSAFGRRDPRAELVEASRPTHGEMWTGYMRGL